MLPTAPTPFSWGQYLEVLVQERGSLSELTRHLLEVAPDSAGLSDDPQTVERGLRRLRGRGHAPGEKYGRLLIRCLGIPEPIALQVKDLGQYHSRLSDLPLPVRRAQLRMWDCAPITESPCASWIHLGHASVVYRDLDAPQVERRLALARLGTRAAGSEATIELLLFEGRLCSDRGDGPGAERALDGAELWIDGLQSGDERACYFARLQDQRAFRRAHGWREHPERIEAALASYRNIPESSAPPFAAFRRAHGTSWCLWRQGDLEGALGACRAASRHAGDGGFVRFRILALSLEAQILESAGLDASPTRLRAGAMAARLQDPMSSAALREPTRAR